MTQPTMAVHRATADDRATAKDTAALDRLAARLPNGPTAAMLNLVRDLAYALDNGVARRACQQLVRDARSLPPPPKRLDGNQFDSAGTAPADLEAETLVRAVLWQLWGDCDALLRAMHGMRAAFVQAPGRELAPVPRTAVQRLRTAGGGR